jgi:hypothetical protein
MRLVWDDIRSRDYEIGVDRGVFYNSSGNAEVWNGLISVQEMTDDSENSTQHIDGLKYGIRRNRGEFAGTIQAFTYPESFPEHGMATMQKRWPFGMSYRTKTKTGYKIHLVYNVLTSVSRRSYTINETSPFSWDFATLPVKVPWHSPSAHLVIDSSAASSGAMVDLENILYGSDDAEGRLPLPDELFAIFDIHAILRVIDNGDGSFTVIGPSSMVKMLDATTFEIKSPTAIYIDDETYLLSSY